MQTHKEQRTQALLIAGLKNTEGAERLIQPKLI